MIYLSNFSHKSNHLLANSGGKGVDLFCFCPRCGCSSSPLDQSGSGTQLKFQVQLLPISSCLIYLFERIPDCYCFRCCWSHPPAPASTQTKTTRVVVSACEQPRRQRRVGCGHASEVNGSPVYLHHPSCLCVGLQEAELAGWSPASCPGSVSVGEEGRSGGARSYIAP